MAAFETYILHCYNFHVCDCCFGSFNFCHDCWTCVSKDKEPKFSISNKMPQLCCQYYFAILKIFISTKEALITKAHLVIIILKLRPNNSFISGTYRGVRGHSLLLSKNLRPLLTLLPSETTSMDDVVRVVWASKTLPQSEQLSEFVSIQKYCVIGALQRWMANNPLYENIQINHRLLKTWEDKFILSGITDNIVHCNTNQHKCKGYATDFNNGNFENDLDIAIVGTNIEGDHINLGCIYSYNDDQRQNLTL